MERKIGIAPQYPVDSEPLEDRDAEHHLDQAIRWKWIKLVRLNLALRVNSVVRPVKSVA